MKNIGKLALIIAFALGLVSVATPVFADNDNDNGGKRKSERSERSEKKTKICHVADGKRHTIEVSTSSVQAHLAHGDTLGKCQDDDDDDDEDDNKKDKSRKIEDKLQKEQDKFLRRIFKRFGIMLSIINPNGSTTTPATTTPPLDTKPPKIDQINVTKSTTTASVSWRTNEQTRGEVRFGTTTPITASSTTVVDSTLSLLHTVNLSNLAPDTLYSYVIVAKDASGNAKESQTLTFRTNAVVLTDTSAPAIVFATNVSLKATSTRVIWVTDEASDSKIWISTTTPVNITGSTAASASALSFFHSLDLGNLSTSTTYFYTISSTDAAGNTGTLTGNSFQTLAN